MAQLTLHPSITEDRVCSLVEQAMSTLSSPGLCIECGSDAEGVEPDARGYRCGACDGLGVYGAEELLFYVGGA